MVEEGAPALSSAGTVMVTTPAWPGPLTQTRASPQYRAISRVVFDPAPMFGLARHRMLADWSTAGMVKPGMAEKVPEFCQSSLAGNLDVWEMTRLFRPSENAGSWLVIAILRVSPLTGPPP